MAKSGTPRPSRFEIDGQVSWLMAAASGAMPDATACPSPSRSLRRCAGGRFVDKRRPAMVLRSRHSSGFSGVLGLVVRNAPRIAPTVRPRSSDGKASPLYSRGVGCDQGARIGSTPRIPFSSPNADGGRGTFRCTRNRRGARSVSIAFENWAHHTTAAEARSLSTSSTCSSRAAMASRAMSTPCAYPSAPASIPSVER